MASVLIVTMDSVFILYFSDTEPVWKLMWCVQSSD